LQNDAFPGLSARAAILLTGDPGKSDAVASLVATADNSETRAFLRHRRRKGV
jgi:hypothetical protein